MSITNSNKDRLYELLDNMSQLADFIENTGIPKEYFDEPTDTKSRFLNDLFLFCRRLYSETYERNKSTNDELERIYNYIAAKKINLRPPFKAVEKWEDVLSHLNILGPKYFRVGHYNSPLIAAVVDRLWPIKGTRGHVLGPFVNIYKAVMENCLANIEKRSKYEVEFSRFMDGVDNCANDLITWDHHEKRSLRGNFNLPHFDPWREVTTPQSPPPEQDTPPAPTQRTNLQALAEDLTNPNSKVNIKRETTITEVFDNQNNSNNYE